MKRARTNCSLLNIDTFGTELCGYIDSTQDFFGRDTICFAAVPDLVCNNTSMFLIGLMGMPAGEWQSLVEIDEELLGVYLYSECYSSSNNRTSMKIRKMTRKLLRDGRRLEISAKSW